MYKKYLIYKIDYMFKKNNEYQIYLKDLRRVLHLKMQMQ